MLCTNLMFLDSRFSRKCTASKQYAKNVNKLHKTNNSL